MLISLCLAQENHFPADTTSVTEGNLCLSTATYIKLREREMPSKSQLFIPFPQLWDVPQLLAVLESGSPDSFAVRVAVLERGEVLNKYKQVQIEQQKVPPGQHSRAFSSAMSEETWSQNRAQLCMGVSNMFTMQKDCPVHFLFQHVVQDVSTAMPVTACRECYVRRLSNALLIIWSCNLQWEIRAASMV